ncbi:MAG: hypothetical protein MI863_21730 [Desulfobacterales bacterium]|nr:hypothetical protein [Desulfobacterales bacterium]
MSVVKDAVAAMKEVLILSEKIDQAGKTLSEVSKELRDHDRRIVRLETYVEIGQVQRKQLPGRNDSN